MVDRKNPLILRRLLALVYDLMPVLALWMLAAAAAVAVRAGSAVPAGHPLFQALLVLLAWAYFSVSWKRGGQTLGMRAWRLRLVSVEAPGGLSWNQALRRFPAGLLAAAPAGVGLWWAWLDRDRRGWHDRLSGSRVIRVNADT